MLLFLLLALMALSVPLLVERKVHPERSLLKAYEDELASTIRELREYWTTAQLVGSATLSVFLVALFLWLLGRILF